MTGNDSRRLGWGAWSLLAAAGGALLVALAVWAGARWGSLPGPLARAPLLVDGEARWIVYPLEPRTAARAGVPLAAELESAIEVPAGYEPRAGAARLEVRMLGRGEVWIGGRSVLRVDEPEPGRAHRAEVGEALRPGRNEVRARVEHDAGPPALRLRLRVEGEPPVELATVELLSDASWRATLEGAEPRPARPASARVEPPRGAPRGAPVAGAAAWRARASRLLLFALIAALVAAVLERLPPAIVHRRRALAVAAVLVGGCWLWFHQAERLPAGLGFDVAGHLEYVDHVQRQGRLPRADEGWQAYQPPLFYLLAAGVLELAGLEASDPAAASWLRALTFTLGAAQVLLLFAALALALPRDDAAQLAGLVFAATLPMHLYLFAYVGNETLAAALSSAVAVTVLWALTRPPSARGAALAGAALGVALLAKVTALALLPLVALLLAWHRLRRGGGRLAAVGDAALSVGVAALISGWHYLRLARVAGSPLAGNWDRALGFAWWQDPGYRTPGDFLRFGRALADPWFAGFEGIADGLWSTLWSDGLVGGRTTLAGGPPWDHAAMAVGAGLALAPALLVALGLARLAVRWWRRPRPLEGFLLGSLAALAAALVVMALRVPSYAQAKAFYLHPALPAVVIGFALGAAWVIEKGSWPRRALVAGLSCWALLAVQGVAAPATATGALVADAEPSAALVARARDRLAARDAGAAEELLRQAAGESPGDLGARLLLAEILAGTGRTPAAIAELRAALAHDPASRALHRGLVELHLRRGDVAGARRHLESLARVAADDPELPTLERRLEALRGG